jgi:opacity protein-like surface antigen
MRSSPKAVSPIALVLTLCVVCPNAVAQKVTFGIKAGYPLLRPLVSETFAMHNPQASPATLGNDRKLMVGPAFEVSVGPRFGVEIAALRKALRSGGTRQTVDRFARTTSTLNVDINSWEFPILGKMYFRAVHNARLYGGLGISERRAGGQASFESVTVQSFNNLPATTDRRDAVRDNWTTGLTVGAGIEIPIRWLHVSPEIRYTSWNGPTFRFLPEPDFLSQFRFLPGNVTVESDLDVLVRFSF